MAITTEQKIGVAALGVAVVGVGLGLGFKKVSAAPGRLFTVDVPQFRVIGASAGVQEGPDLVVMTQGDRLLSDWILGNRGTEDGTAALFIRLLAAGGGEKQGPPAIIPPGGEFPVTVELGSGSQAPGDYTAVLTALGLHEGAKLNESYTFIIRILEAGAVPGIELVAVGDPSIVI